MLSLNQVIKRIETIAKAHKQINSFYYSNLTTYLQDKTIKYPSCMVVDTGNAGAINLLGKTYSYPLQIMLLDLINVSEKTEANETEVQSDMGLVAADIVAQMDHDSYNDWKVSAATATIIRDTQPDECAGVMINLTIDVIWEQDVCAIPSTLQLAN